ncbi:MAG: 2-amino-4-hydroxy-6-hydroxymethyldihydropteridine diphosphokinase [Bacteroidales bacterium]|jgi:2-amino-4-hydroxy-6-hydroxymethyldihydropteridine diphosphokinase|nr:2-amino-4-hydroxy-6-hydroxymethyldihydropteridine diphosphokinase [Bacteroidales bacterium]
MNIVLGLGTNMGEREENLRQACLLLSQRLGKITAQSAIIETKPMGFDADTDFLNAAIVIRTDKTPLEALAICLDVEQALGRIRTKPHYESRTIDIDILFCDDLIINTPQLCLPHPRIAERSFVLIPLKQIIPDFIHPVLQIPIKDL